MKQLALLLATSLLFSFTDHSTLIQSDLTSIRFGNGGGFSGIETTHSLDRKGQLNNIQETVSGKNNAFIKFIGKKEAKIYFDQAKALNNYQYNAPDNTYSFLEFRGEKTHRIVWGDSTKVDARALSLYNKLNALLVK